MTNQLGQMVWQEKYGNNPCSEIMLGSDGETTEDHSDTSMQYVIRPSAAFTAPPVFVQANKNWGWIGKCPTCGTVGKTGEPCFRCPRPCNSCSDPRPCKHELKERARRLLGPHGTLRRQKYGYLHEDGTVCSSVMRESEMVVSFIAVNYEERTRCGKPVGNPEFTSLPVNCIGCLAD